MSLTRDLITKSFETFWRKKFWMKYINNITSCQMVGLYFQPQIDKSIWIMDNIPIKGGHNHPQFSSESIYCLVQVISQNCQGSLLTQIGGFLGVLNVHIYFFPDPPWPLFSTDSLYNKGISGFRFQFRALCQNWTLHQWGLFVRKVCLSSKMHLLWYKHKMWT